MISRFDPARPGSVAALALVAGLLAGLLAAAFLTVAGEPSIERAIAIEEAAAHAAAGPGHEAGEDPLVSRDVQKGAGLFAAYALTGAAFGLLLAATFALLRRSPLDLFGRAVAAGALLAGALTVSPWLKYPPNPPAVGDPSTLADRQRLYVLLILLTVALLAGVAHLSRRLRERGWDPARRTAALAAAIVLPLLTLYALLPPAPDDVTVPATLVWRFRIASLGGNLVLWAVLTLGFGLVAAASAGARRRPDVLAPAAA